MVAAAAAAKVANAHKVQPGQGQAGQTAEDTGPLPLGVGFWKYQAHAEYFYNKTSIQVSVAGLIVLNFLINILQAQIAPKGDRLEGFFAGWDLFFNVVFLFELALNMYGTLVCRFWKSGWNCFDFTVVVIGWAFQLNVPLPGPMKLLRMMRAFRVFRLFKRIKSLKKIMVSLAKSIPGVMNAFLIQLIIICIFAIIAVDRFREYGKGGFYTNEKDQRVDFKTARGQDYGFEYFGDFGKSLYTMFQVLTGESWAEAITRPLFNSDGPMTSTGSAFFFCFFTLLNGVVLINVVVAELLEKFVDDPLPEDDGSVPVDPLQEKIDETKQQIDDLQKQMDYMVRVTASLQKQFIDVKIVKAQVAALVAHRAPALAEVAEPQSNQSTAMDEPPPEQPPPPPQHFTPQVSSQEPAALQVLDNAIDGVAEPSSLPEKTEVPIDMGEFK